MDKERKVKGSVILDMAKVIRFFKDKPWGDYLTAEDMEIVKSMVIPTAWYPIESYQRMGVAVFELVAGGNMEVVKTFGEQAMAELFKGTYKPFLDKGDPHEALGKFLDLRRGLFNFSRMTMEKTGDKSARVTISDFGDLGDGVDVFAALLDVHLKTIAELNGGKGVSCQCARQDLSGDQALVYDLAWA